MFSRRWALFAVTVVVLAYGCYLLGQWQFHRLHDREHTNITTKANLEASPEPVDRVLSPGRAPAVDDEWRRVTASGRYLPDRSVVIRYQTRDGASGVDIVTHSIPRVAAYCSWTAAGWRPTTWARTRWTPRLHPAARSPSWAGCAGTRPVMRRL
jgi:hypothetical protein